MKNEDVLKEAYDYLNTEINATNEDQKKKYFDKSINLDPNNSTTFVNKGISLKNLNWFDNAIECFEKALQINPLNSESLFNKGLCLSRLNRNEKAIEYYDRAI